MKKNIRKFSDAVKGVETTNQINRYISNIINLIQEQGLITLLM